MLPRSYGAAGRSVSQGAIRRSSYSRASFFSKQYVRRRGSGTDRASWRHSQFFVLHGEGDRGDRGSRDADVFGNGVIGQQDPRVARAIDGDHDRTSRETGRAEASGEAVAVAEQAGGELFVVWRN